MGFCHEYVLSAHLWDILLFVALSRRKFYDLPDSLLHCALSLPTNRLFGRNPKPRKPSHSKERGLPRKRNPTQPHPFVDIYEAIFQKPLNSFSWMYRQPTDFPGHLVGLVWLASICVWPQKIYWTHLILNGRLKCGFLHMPWAPWVAAWGSQLEVWICTQRISSIHYWHPTRERIHELLFVCSVFKISFFNAKQNKMF